MKKTHKTCLLLCIGSLLTPLLLNGQDDLFSEDDDLFSMSLEDLLNVEVETGNLTGITASKVPVSITTITSEDIDATPHRNLLDVIETYVPGAIWSTHNEGYHPGFRGIISDRNYKFLLRVNGVLMNQKAQAGAISENSLWDLDDIHKIEVVRGPGSVTYGPGAIMGVINITTKNAQTSPGWRVSAEHITEYDSSGVNVSYGHVDDNWDFYIFGSVTQTDGYENPAIAGTGFDGSVGYVGDGINRLDSFRGDIIGSSSAPPAAYMKDRDGDPQIKLYAEANFNEDWRVFARYTQYASTLHSAAVVRFGAQGVAQEAYLGDLDGDSEIDIEEIVLGDFVDMSGQHSEQFIAAIENKSEFDVMAGLTVDTLFSFSSEIYKRTVNNTRMWDDTTDPELVQRLRDPFDEIYYFQSFAEDEWLLRSIARLDINENHTFALGVEGSWNVYGAAWGEDDEYLSFNDSGRLLSGPESIYYGSGPAQTTSAEFIGSGWDAFMGSIMTEYYGQLSPMFSVVASGRMDKHDFSNYLWSPRIALITELTENDTIKLAWQKSERMNTATQAYNDNLNGELTESETLSSLELIYTRIFGDNVLFNVSGYLNEGEFIGWNGSSTSTVGDIEYYGFDVELSYRSDKWTFGLNHALTKLISWDMVADLPEGRQRQGISLSSYDWATTATDGTPIVRADTGNSINNYADNVTKVFGRYEIIENLTLSADARVIWAMPGTTDTFDQVEDATRGTVDEATNREIREFLEDRGAGDIDFRLNLAGSYKFNDTFELTVYAQNILSLTDNKRYFYDAGDNNRFPIRVSWLEEPTSIGLKLTSKF